MQIMLLDLIHEDLNKVTVKPYIELPTYDHFEEDQSSAMWSYHLQRQNSQIRQRVRRGQTALAGLSGESVAQQRIQHHLKVEERFRLAEPLRVQIIETRQERRLKQRRVLCVDAPVQQDAEAAAEEEGHRGCDEDA